jgi:hypothetical protein
VIGVGGVASSPFLVLVAAALSSSSSAPLWLLANEWDDRKDSIEFDGVPFNTSLTARAVDGGMASRLIPSRVSAASGDI